MTTPALSVMALTENPQLGVLQWRGAGHPDTLQEGFDGIVKLIKQLAPDAVIVPYQPPPHSHVDLVQEKRTGIYDTHRKGR